MLPGYFFDSCTLLFSYIDVLELNIGSADAAEVSDEVAVADQTDDQTAEVDDDDDIDDGEMDDDEDEDASLVEVWFDLICVFPSGFKHLLNPRNTVKI